MSQDTSAAPNVVNNINVGVPAPNVVFSPQQQKTSFFVRFIWFVFVGWWLSGLMISAAILSFFFVVTAPLGFWFINRVPKAQTLRDRTTEFRMTHENGTTYIRQHGRTQIAWYWRALYFPVGVFLGSVWLAIAWLVSFGIITIPLSIWMIDRSPQIFTLERN